MEVGLVIASASGIIEDAIAGSIENFFVHTILPIILIVVVLIMAVFARGSLLKWIIIIGMAAAAIYLGGWAAVLFKGA